MSPKCVCLALTLALTLPYVVALVAQRERCDEAADAAAGNHGSGRRRGTATDSGREGGGPREAGQQQQHALHARRPRRRRRGRRDEGNCIPRFDTGGDIGANPHAKVAVLTNDDRVHSQKTCAATSARSASQPHRAPPRPLGRLNSQVQTSSTRPSSLVQTRPAGAPASAPTEKAPHTSSRSSIQSSASRFSPPSRASTPQYSSGLIESSVAHSSARSEGPASSLARIGPHRSPGSTKQ
eukprot:scaffold18011_cov64-Phaeocystis_antarctica.AAC.4